MHIEWRNIFLFDLFIYFYQWNEDTNVANKTLFETIIDQLS